MNGSSRSSTVRRGRLARAALVAVIALVGLVAVPGTASAAGSVTPFVDCVRQNGNGAYTAILGYTNSSGSAVTIPLGSTNTISPKRLNGRQPTRFEPGTRHGAFPVNLTKSEMLAGPSWFLDGSYASGWSGSTGSTACPPSTELPEEGNGTGPAIALAAAGVVGAFAVHRARRRALASAAAPARDGGDDA